MDSPLHILILEDRIRDAELLLHELQKSGIAFEWVRVETEEDFLQQLDQAPDIILADYSMPQFDATRALEILRENDRDIPFIIISGTIGEDAAVTAMKLGASDFFAKNKLTRLIPALERELRDAQERRKRRKAEAELRRAQEQFSKAFQLSPVGITITTFADGRFVDVNNSFLQIVSYSRDEVIGHTAAELNIWVEPADRQHAVGLLQEHGTVRDNEVQVRTKRGELRDVLVSIEQIELDDKPCLLALVHDVTEHKQSEIAIRESEERFRLLAENSTDMISRQTPDGVFLYVSPACYALLGYEPQELLGRSAYDFLHPDDLAATVTAQTAADQVSDTSTVQYRVRRKNGAYIWFETTNKTIRDDQTGKVREIQAASRDISERRRAEDSLQQYNERLMTLHSIDQAILTAQTADLVASLAIRYFLDKMNVPAVSMTAFDFEAGEAQLQASTRGEPLAPAQHVTLDAWSLDDIAALRSGDIQVMERGSAEMIPGLQALQRDDLSAYLRVPLLAQGELVGVLNLAAESTDTFGLEYREVAREIADQLAIAIQQTHLIERIRRHTAELEQRVVERTAELDWAKRRVESILHHSSDAIILARSNGEIEQINPGFSEFFGYAPEDAFEMSMSALVEASYASILAQTLRTVTLEKQPARLEIVCRRSDGSTVDADMVLAPLPEGFGAYQSVICSVRDMTVRKQMEEELRQALEKERELNELKSRFVSIVSHEFRTPLTSILSSSQLLKLYRAKMSLDRQDDHLDTIELQVRRLTELLNDVLTLSRAEAVGFEFSPAPLNLETFCRHSVEEIQVITKTPHRISLTTSSACGQFVGDEKLLRHIVVNLLTNAIKYSPDGGNVQFDLTCDGNQVILRVADQGMGIPEDDQKHLFEPFHRAKNVGDISGTGLGLPIVKRAVDAHGGTIVVESKVGVGTTFTVRLPLRPAQ